MKTLRASLLTLGLCTVSLAARGDDPPQWRDRRPRCPSEQWDALEGRWRWRTSTTPMKRGPDETRRVAVAAHEVVTDSWGAGRG